MAEKNKSSEQAVITDRRASVVHKWIVYASVACGVEQAQHEYEFESKRKAQAFIRRFRAAWEVVYPDAVVVLYDYQKITETNEDGLTMWQTETKRAIPTSGGSIYHITEKNLDPAEKILDKRAAVCYNGYNT